MNDDFFQLPSSFIKSIEMIQEHNNRLNATLEPIRRQNALVNAALSPINAEFEHLNQVMSVANAPMQEVINQYQGFLNNLATSIPDFDSNTTSLISSLSPTIDELFRNDSFPLTPSDEWTEKEYSEFVNQELENAIGSDMVSEIHKSYQESPSNIPNNSVQTDVIDNTVEHSDLRSDLTSKEWHKRMWVEQTYGIIIQLMYALSIRLISSDAFIKALNEILEVFKNN